MAIAQQSMSLEEFLCLPEEKPALELVDGRITQKVAPQGQHSIIETMLPEQINVFARPRKLALALTELRSSFAGASRVPDVCVYLWERIPRLPDGKIANVFTTPPDLAIEIVSPGQSVAGQVRRCQRFITDGVRLVLLVDPDDESVVRFGSDGTVQVLQNEDLIDLD